MNAQLKVWAKNHFGCEWGLLQDAMVAREGLTHRTIIPFSKWLITMVSKTPKSGNVPLPKWPKPFKFLETPFLKFLKIPIANNLFTQSLLS